MPNMVENKANFSGPNSGLQVGQNFGAITIQTDSLLGKLKVAEGAAFDSYENQHDECLPGTRVEFLREIKEWTESPHGKCIFWLNGMAGTGKSTISRTIASHLKKNKSLGASFFFKRDEEDRGNAKKLFPTLIRQLVDSIPQLTQSIEEAIKDDPYISGKALGEQFNKLLFQPLQNVNLDQITSRVIVIDALDECKSEEKKDDIRAILQLLPRVQMSKHVQLRFFLTSRPELPIRLGFGDIIGNHQDLDLHDVPRSEIEGDISLFLKRKFSRICRDHGLSPSWPSEEALQTLVARTVPLFISAATLCRFIDDANWDPQDRLQEILADKSTYVSKMAGTYLPILKQLLVGQNKREIRQLIQEFKKIVGTIVVLATPLSIATISHLLGVETNNIRKRLDRLHSVLNIPDNLDIPVKLLHLSFRDFLLDAETKDEEESEQFWIDKKAMHQALTDHCIEAMDRSLKRNICNLQDNSAQRSDVTSCSINCHLPLELQYACHYWTQHLVQSQCPVTMLIKAFSFLKVHFLHWVEAMSILGIVSEVVGVIKNLQSVIQEDQYPEISEFLEDARRFILKSQQIADAAPLQLYSSGLIFAPRNSITRKIFNNELSTQYQLPKVKETWSAELQTLEGHSHLVESVAFSPNGELLASGSDDKTIKLWDPTTGELRQTLEGHSLSVQSVAFSLNGELLASGSYDKTVKLWDPTTGELQRTLEGHSNSVQSIAFSPNSKLLASGSYDKTVKLWDPTTGGLRWTLEGHSLSVQSVAFSLNGELLASGSNDNTVKLWDPTTGELRRTLEGHSDWVESVAFSPNGELLASGSYDKTVKLWNPTTGELQRTLEGNSIWVQSVTFSPNGKLLASGSYDKTVKLWDPTTGELWQTLEGHSDVVQSVAFSLNGELLASGSSDKTVKLWDPTTGELQLTLESHSDLVQSIAFSPNGELLASGSNDETVKLWDPTTGELRRTLEGHSYWVQSVTFSPNGELLASGSYDKTVKLWNPTTGELQRTLEGHSHSVPSVAFSPNGELLASGSYDKTVKLWNPTTGELRRTLEGNSHLVRSVAFSPNGELLASGSSDETVKLWDPTTGELRRTLEGHSHWVESVAFSPNGELLASRSYDKIVKLWDPTTGELRQTLEGHSNLVWSETSFRVSIIENQWLCFQGKRILWLPLEYRPICLALKDGILSLGHASGRISFISMSHFI